MHRRGYSELPPGPCHDLAQMLRESRDADQLSLQLPKPTDRLLIIEADGSRPVDSRAVVVTREGNLRRDKGTRPVCGRQWLTGLQLLGHALGVSEETCDVL